MSDLTLLTTIDADEVSPVRRGANRKGVVLKEEGDAMGIDPEVADILSVPWAHEGAMLDALRKEGVDEAVQKSMVGGLRLLSGSAGELPDAIREVVEKLGVEMYARVNRPLNTSHGIPGAGELTGGAASAENDPVDDTASGADTAAEVTSDEDLEATVPGAPAVGKDDGDIAMAACDDMDDDGVMKDGKEPYGNVTYADPGHQSDGKKRYPLDTPEHVRAAWSYINMPKNASKYSSSQLASVKGKIKAAMTRAGADVKKDDDPDENAVQRALATIAKAMRRKPQGEKPGDGPDDKEPDGDPDDTAVNKGGTVDTHAAVPIKKEDGSWDYSGVPDETVAFYKEIVEKGERLETLLTETVDRLAKSQDTIRSAEVIQKAEAFKFVAPVEDLAEVLKAASEHLEPELVEKLEQMLGAANERLESSDLFKELGAKHLIGAGESPGDAWSKIEKMADDLVEKSDISKEAAITKVLDSEAGKRLYEQYNADQLAAGGVN